MMDAVSCANNSCMADFTVFVLRKPIEHVIRRRKVREWAQSSTKGGPAEMLRRKRVRKMLSGG
jgi:hypothetical protein